MIELIALTIKINYAHLEVRERQGERWKERDGRRETERIGRRETKEMAGER